MVTRGGTNELHGEALVLERRPGFIARPSLAATKTFSQWATFSGNVGGKIIKDKLWYFASGEYEPLDGPRAITITPANALALENSGQRFRVGTVCAAISDVLGAH